MGEFHLKILETLWTTCTMVKSKYSSLERFLKTAQRLKLEGLIGDKENADELEDEFLININDVSSNYDTEAFSDADLISSPKVKLNQNKIDEALKNVIVPIDIEEVNNLKDKVSEYLEECSEGSYQCTVFGKYSSLNQPKRVQKQSIQRHIESFHVGGITYSCNVCMKTSKSKKALSMHKSKYHK